MTVENYIIEHIDELYTPEIKALVIKLNKTNDKLDESIAKAEKQYLELYKNIPRKQI